MSELGLFAPEHQSIPGTYMLPYLEIGRLIKEAGLLAFVSELSAEIEAVYQDPSVEGLERSGFSEGAHTIESMLCQDENYRVCKIIASNPDNAKANAPTVTGTMFMYKRGKAAPALICDASVTTALRTATTTALVLDKLEPDLETLTVVGAGLQGESHATVAALLLPNLKRIVLQDIDPSTALHTAQGVRSLIGETLDNTDVNVEVASQNHPVESESEAIVTATYGTQEALTGSQVQDGVIVAAVGADMAGKRELNPSIYRRAKFVTDELQQSLREGELQHAALRLGIGGAREVITKHHGSLLGGRIIGITELLADPACFIDRDEPITIYDSTGFAGQDLAVGKLLLRMLESSN